MVYRYLYRDLDKHFFANTSFNAAHILGILKVEFEDEAGRYNTLKDFFVRAFTNDYIYYRYEDAAVALDTAGTYECFKVVHRYLVDTKGEEDTIDYLDPVPVANQLLYIQGEKITQAVAAWLGVDIDSDLSVDQFNKLLCVKVENLIPFLDDYHSFAEY